MNKRTLVSGLSIAQKRLEDLYWPLYKHTPCKSLMREGDKYIISIAGRKEFCRHFIAHGTINKVETIDPMYEFEYSFKLTKEIIKFSDVNFLKTPPKIHNIMDQLDLLERHNHKLGLALAGGIKRINKSDYDLIVNS